MQKPVKDHIGNTKEQHKNYVEGFIESLARKATREQRKEFRGKSLAAKIIINENDCGV
jgi:hypothetical protein